MKLTTIDRKALKLISDRCTVAVKNVCRELGLEARDTGGQYGGTHGTLKFKISLPSDEAGITPEDRKTWDQCCEMYELKADWLGQEFTMNEDRFRIIGLNTRRPKFPVAILRLRDGSRRKTQASTVRRAMQIKEDW